MIKIMEKKTKNFTSALLKKKEINGLNYRLQISYANPKN